MEAHIVDQLPDDAGWQFEPKWDGFRCLAFRDGNAVELRAKSGKTLTRYFPEIADYLRRVAPSEFVLDGELAILIDNKLSFDALQLRLHPAESRIRKLAAETPAIYFLFDLLLAPGNKSLLDEPLRKRRQELERLYPTLKKEPALKLSPYTRDAEKAREWLEGAGGSLDGVVAKQLDAAYTPGERTMLKVKRLRTADCVVGGFRYGEGTREVGSLLLGLYNDDGKLDHVGFTSGIASHARRELTKRLEKLRRPPGFTGRAPGGPSRWSTERTGEWEPLAPRLVAEVRYDHVSSGRFRHGTKFLRWRPDKSPRQCTFDQLGKPSADFAARLMNA